MRSARVSGPSTPSPANRITDNLDDTGVCCPFGKINLAIRMSKLCHCPVLISLTPQGQATSAHAGEMNTGILLFCPSIVVLASA